jgi:hypothetical protein
MVSAVKLGMRARLLVMNLQVPIYFLQKGKKVLQD